MYGSGDTVMASLYSSLNCLALPDEKTLRHLFQVKLASPFYTFDLYQFSASVVILVDGNTQIFCLIPWVTFATRVYLNAISHVTYKCIVV